MDTMKPSHIEVAGGLPFITIPLSLLSSKTSRLRHRWCAARMVSTGLKLDRMSLGGKQPGSLMRWMDADIPAVIAATEAVNDFVSETTGARTTLPFLVIRPWDAGGRIVTSLVAVVSSRFRS